MNGIDIPYENNEPVLELLYGTPMSIAVILNEESKLQSSDVKSLLGKLQSFLPSSDRFKISNNTQFRVHHYAGDVLYHANRFIEKNRDTVPDGVVQCFAKSTRTLVAELFSSTGEATVGASGGGASLAVVGSCSRETAFLIADVLNSRLNMCSTHMLEGLHV